MTRACSFVILAYSFMPNAQLLELLGNGEAGRLKRCTQTPVQKGAGKRCHPRLGMRKGQV